LAVDDRSREKDAAGRATQTQAKIETHDQNGADDVAVNELFYLYFAGIIYFTLAMGHQRKHKPQNFLVDFLTVFLILLWPLFFVWALLPIKKRQNKYEK